LDGAVSLACDREKTYPAQESDSGSTARLDTLLAEVHTMPEPHVELVQTVCRLIDDHSGEPLTLADLGAAVDVSPAHLQRVFKRILGISPRQYADARRLGQFKARLKEKRTVTTALYEAGYGSASRVYERAAGQLGMTPGAYRAGGQSVTIRYTLVDCPLGRLLLAGTEKGVSAVYLGDADGPLADELKREFPAAALARDDEALAEWAGQVRRHLQGGLPHLDLPLDVRATAFQWRVWQQLQAIPRGQTRTYRQVAEALGQPTAARAVARACATNPVSILVPCHRVVRGDGGLGGYRWGLQRKKKLLEKEREVRE
jgi:AraC family transcriptional regulator of adaptative response/methylated-DNA-[protein]-cysteine methyltransferase